VQEALGELVEEDFVLRIHCAVASLEVGKVIVRGKGSRIAVHATNRFSRKGVIRFREEQVSIN